MLYLLKSTYFDEDNNKLSYILKIGYARDINHRLIQYYTHNPSITLLDKREGSENLEKHLHKYFSNFNIGKSEWFKYDEEIINKFQSINLNTPIPSDNISYNPKVNARIQKNDKDVSKLFHKFLKYLYTNSIVINKFTIEFLNSLDLTKYMKDYRGRHPESLEKLYDEYYSFIKPKIDKYNSELSKHKDFILEYLEDNVLPLDDEIVSKEDFLKEFEKKEKEKEKPSVDNNISNSLSDEFLIL